jgi:hypothetical protein
VFIEQDRKFGLAATDPKERTMKRILMAALAGVSISTAALADKPVSPAEAEKIKAALQVWGCSGGKMEQETEGSGIYEVDDATCHGARYDIKLDKEFKVTSITSD